MSYDEDEPREAVLAELDRQDEERDERWTTVERAEAKAGLWFCSECHEPNVAGRWSCATCRVPRCTCATTEPDMDGHVDQVERDSCPRHG